MLELKRYTCITCGAPLKEQDGKFVCANCKNEFHLEEKISEEEVVALNRATTDRNLLRFDDAFEEYDLLLKKYPKNEMANWGAFLSFYGIVYEQDLDGKYIPTCHRFSEKPVESSKYYYLFNDEHKRRAEEIEKLRVAIAEKAKRIPPYDVFICYKATEERFGRPYPTKESSWARDVYEMLTHELKLRVFFAEKSLGDSNEEYEPHIYSALNSAKLMFVMTTGIENVNAVWVKNEWKRYSKYIQEGQKKTIRVVYDNIEPYDLPLELQKTQAINHNEMDWGTKVKKAAQAIFVDPLEEERKKKEAEEKARKAREEAEARERAREEELQKMREAMEALKKQANAPKPALAPTVTAPTPAPTITPTLTAPVRRGESVDKYCVKCGAGNVKNAKFCADCSHNVFAPEFKQYCLECGTETELLKKFCPNCAKNNFGYDKDAYAKEQERKKQEAIAREFDIENGVLKKYKGQKKSVVIPDIVKSVGDGAFAECKNLTSIIIPNSVTSIDYLAFKNCTSLTNITVPECVTSIGEAAFYNCNALTSIIIPEGVTRIGKQAFYNCSALTSITIPNCVTSIEDRTFYGCGKLTSITIPDGVISIGNSSFEGCKNIRAITIPNGVTSIAYSAFKDCTGLTAITIPDSVSKIGASAFTACISLENITMPNGVTSIEGQTFSYCKSLTSVTIPDSVTSIGNSAFEGCDSLTNITLSSNLSNIGNSAFKNCTLLKKITIPDGVMSIGDSAFKGCISLTGINIPDLVTSIKGYVFYDCSSLTGITIPDGVTSIGSYAFV